MRFTTPVAVALLLGFLVGHGTDAPADLFVLLTSIVIVYCALGMADVLQALSRGRRSPRAGTRRIGANRAR